MRQPLEDGNITVSRALGSINYPAAVMLVAAMNPCPCGFLTDPQKECVCTPLQIQRYRSRVSGPLLDRIDIQVEVPAIRYQDLASAMPVSRRKSSRRPTSVRPSELLISCSSLNRFRYRNSTVSSFEPLSFFSPVFQFSL